MRLKKTAVFHFFRPAHFSIQRFKVKISRWGRDDPQEILSFRNQLGNVVVGLLHGVLVL